MERSTENWKPHCMACSTRLASYRDFLDPRNHKEDCWYLKKRKEEKKAKTDPESLLERWRFHEILENTSGVILGLDRIKEWSKDPDHKLTCVFCREELPIDSWYCPFCREYKGLMPLIPDWDYFG